MTKKVISILIVILVLGALGYTAYDFVKLDQDVNPDNSLISPISEKLQENNPKYDSELAKKDVINVLLLGIDRRSRAEYSYRTDIMILASINKTDNRVVLTSVPRDLWYGGGRLNALYIQQGWESVQDAFEEITGQRPDRYVLTDFADFSWIVDAMGGVPVDVEITFTDSSYPVDATKGYQTVSFTKGAEVMTGERALIFARSRKGDFDNGDWGRMKRQHLLLKGMLEAATQPKSFVCDYTDSNPGQSCESSVNANVIKEVFDVVTTNKMETNFELSDLTYLWDFYKERNAYKIDSLLVDYEFLYTPPAAEYGGAWVLAPVGGSYYNLHSKLEDKLTGVEQVPEVAAAEDLNEGI